MDDYVCTIGCTNNGEITGETNSYTYGTGGIVGQIFSSSTPDVGSKTYVIACRNLSPKVTLASAQKSGGIVGYQNRQLSGVYGSYTVKSDEINPFYACVAYNPNSATNGTNDILILRRVLTLLKLRLMTWIQLSEMHSVLWVVRQAHM